jgi:23S rRNA pseudouridine1911/1915/1917 synthase
VRIELGADLAGQRLDKALATAAPDLSRARLQALIAAGQVSLLVEGQAPRPMPDGKAKAPAGLYEVRRPAAGRRRARAREHPAHRAL